MPQRNIFIGASGIVQLDMEHSIVTKMALLPDNTLPITTEERIYRRLGSHPCITKFIEMRDGKLVLELLQCSLTMRFDKLFKAGGRPSRDRVLRWAKQIAFGFEHIHSRNIKQVDIRGQNILLDFNDNAKLADFAGSSIDNSKPLVHPGPHFWNPKLHVPSIEAEIFAIGSLFYELETTRSPYHEKSEPDVTKLFECEQFPDTSSLFLGKVIQSCWNSTYSNVSKILKDLEDLEDIDSTATFPSQQVLKNIEFGTPEVRSHAGFGFSARPSLPNND